VFLWRLSEGFSYARTARFDIVLQCTRRVSRARAAQEPSMQRRAMAAKAACVGCIAMPRKHNENKDFFPEYCGRLLP
jgi:hypothetical protein